MRCEDTLCGEVVAVAGTVAPWNTEVNGRVLSYHQALYPAFFYPAPPIIEVPSAQGGFALLIIKSFELFWVDPEACANCLRRYMEAILDDCYVPSIPESGIRRMPLSWRIQKFSSLVEPTNADHVAESFRKLKIIGDMGSHYDLNEIPRRSLLDAYDVFEDCVRHLYGEDEKQRIAQVRTRLAAELNNPQ
jgi:hypothetical protein